MRTFLKAAALAATALTATLPFSAPVHAQAAQAQIVIVDMEEVVSTSAAGKGEQAVLQGKANSLQSRVKPLSDGFQKDGADLHTEFAKKTLAQAATGANDRNIEERKSRAPHTKKR